MANKTLFDEEKVSKMVRKWQKHRNTALFEEIILECHALIRHIAEKAYRRMPNPIESPEDLTHDAIIKLPQILSDFSEAMGSRVFSYLNTCVGNFFKSQIHKLAIRGMASYDTETDLYADPMGLDQFEIDQRIDVAARVSEIDIPYFDENSQQVLIYYMEAFKEGNFSRNRKKLAQTVAYMFDMNLSECTFLYQHLKVCLRSSLIDLHISRNVDIMKVLDAAEKTHLPRMVELIGMENTQKILSVFGGMTIRIPSTKKIQKLTEGAEIYKRLQSSLSNKSVNEIADEYDITKRRAKKVHQQFSELLGKTGEFGDLRVTNELLEIINGPDSDCVFDDQDEELEKAG